MKTTNDSERKNLLRMRLAWILSGIVLGVSVLVAVLVAVRGHRTVIDLENYVNVGTDAGGNPAVLLDVDAILNDLRLPNPNRPGVKASDYPEVYALCTAKMRLVPIDAEHMRVTIEADTETLARYGISFAATTWEQQVKGFVEGATPTPVPLPQTETPAPANTPEPAESDGYLTSLLDADGNGLNLRSVCEAVHSERDLLCKEIFGNNYDTTKTQVAFIVYTGGRHTNLYRASYTATFRPEDGAEPVSIWFTVDVYDLYREGGRIRYGSIDVSMYDSEEESKRLPSSGNVTKLWGGGVRVNGKNGFDLNGFVRFPNCPTSYRLANGVYWSPTYDLLDEDMIWALTAVDGHSLANLLRYARKEIYARYYTAFDPKTEREFNEHYRAYAWYEPRTPDLSGLMTEAEKSNIRLLREIQSLIEK
ncbi:MAG: YARHG domain-containing protein [Clostridia bacterium]|nr:YARHG domain-containing protein [Clostridia bacterium]